MIKKGIPILNESNSEILKIDLMVDLSLKSSQVDNILSLFIRE